MLRRVPPAQVTRLAIAEEAGVDPNLIRYYFGTVPELISEVVLNSHSSIFSALEAIPKTMPPEEWLRLRFDKWLNLFIDNPYHHQLLISVMYADLASETHTLWTQSLERSVGYTKQAIDKGEASGQLRSVDPRFLHLALLGMMEFFANNQAIIKDMFGPDASPETLRDGYRDFIHDLILNGLKVRKDNEA